MGLFVEGYAAVFGSPDFAGDLILKGAFSDWIRASSSDLVLPIYWVHAHSLKVGGSPLAIPVGATTLLAQRERGLYFAGELDNSMYAERLAWHVIHGSANGASFGYRTLPGGERATRMGRELSRLTVEEISITPTGRSLHPAAFVRPMPAAAAEPPAEQGAAA
jgi:HK97 family phage prohead protease